jgi:hypothetical protein
MATTDQLVDDLNSITTYETHPRVIRDVFFKGTPRLAYLRDHCLNPFDGGVFSQAIFRYASHVAAAYGRGAAFDISKRQTLGVTRFEPRFYFGNITEYMEDIRVINRGDPKIIDYVDADMDGVMKTLNTLIAIDANNYGQTITSLTVVPTDRILAINGILEALNDGVTQGPTGDVFVNYGNAARNTTYGSVLNSIPRYFGSTGGALGPANYNTLEEMYQDCCFDGEEPDLINANLAPFTYMKQKIQLMQRIMQERDPIWGVTGFHFNGAMALPDRYFWSKRYGASDPILGNWKSPTTFTANSTNDALSGLPADGSTAVNVGEVISMENTSSFELRITDDELFGFGFSGFKPGIDSTLVAGQVLAEINMEDRDPRLSKLGFGIGS